MKKQSICILITLLLLFALSPAASAEEVFPLVVDNADLLTASEEGLLTEMAQNIRGLYSMDAVILTVESLEGKSAQDYADDYYDYNGYGYGKNADGLLFLLAMNEREWYISTYGDALYAVTDYSVQQLGEQAVWYFSSADYYGGFHAYLTDLPRYLYAYQEGIPIDGYDDSSGDYYHGDREEIVYYEEDTPPSLVISLVVGILIGGISVFVMRSAMNTKRKQHGAFAYMLSGSFHLRTCRDLFLYSNVTKTRRQQSSNSSHRGGGSSVHRSSSGRRHGGGGGRF